MLQRTRLKDKVDVTFILPGDLPAGPVSVVGDFNAWEPGAHTLAKRKDGTRAVSVQVPAEQRVYFRYLAEGGHWFDEADADGHDGRNGYIDN
ncbi:isoamylase early set domain-containing protein [Streptomycetaceae bacterium NBC_01309]